MNIWTLLKQKDTSDGLLKGLKSSALAKRLKKDLPSSLANVDSLSEVGKLISALIKGIDPSMLTGALADNKDIFTK